MFNWLALIHYNYLACQMEDVVQSYQEKVYSSVVDGYLGVDPLYLTGWEVEVSGSSLVALEHYFCQSSMVAYLLLDGHPVVDKTFKNQGCNA